MGMIKPAVLGKLRVGIIDVFGKKKGIPINGIAKDFTHGEMTSGVLTALVKDLDVTISKIPVKPRNGSSNMSFDFKSLLKQLKKINKNGKDYDYINISTSSVIPYEVVGLEQGGKELANPTVLQRIRDMILKNPRQLELSGQIPHIIEELERINQSGTKIFISACNKPRGFNAFSLAKGVHTIGGCNGITKEPISRFSSNPLVESYENLPVYITKQRAITHETEKTALSLNGIIPIQSELSKLSRWELAKKVATKDDYLMLKEYVENLYATGKFKFDIDFLRFKLVSSVDKNLRNKIFDINKFMEIFQDKFDKEVLQYTFPQGTHCDLMFRQFFDMTSKSKHVISMRKTTKIPNTVSGTSFAAPQGLNHAIREELSSYNFSRFG